MGGSWLYFPLEVSVVSAISTGACSGSNGSASAVSGVALGQIDLRCGVSTGSGGCSSYIYPPEGYIYTIRIYIPCRPILLIPTTRGGSGGNEATARADYPLCRLPTPLPVVGSVNSGGDSPAGWRDCPVRDLPPTTRYVASYPRHGRCSP